MMDTTTYIWFVTGVMAGFIHASMLWRGAHRLSAWAPLLGVLRLGVVAAILAVAAIFGGVLAAAAGWVFGLVSLVTWFLLRRPS